MLYCAKLLVSVHMTTWWRERGAKVATKQHIFSKAD